MKSVGLTALMLLVMQPALSEEPEKLDDIFMQRGMIDNNFNVTDEKKFSIAMQEFNQAAQLDYKERIRNGRGVHNHIDAKGLLKVVTLSPGVVIFKPEDLVVLREKSLNSACIVFGDSKVLRKRNWPMRVEFHDSEHVVKAAFDMTVNECAE